MAGQSPFATAFGGRETGRGSHALQSTCRAVDHKKYHSITFFLLSLRFIFTSDEREGLEGGREKRDYGTGKGTGIAILRT